MGFTLASVFVRFRWCHAVLRCSVDDERGEFYAVNGTTARHFDENIIDFYALIVG